MTGRHLVPGRNRHMEKGFHSAHGLVDGPAHDPEKGADLRGVPHRPQGRWPWNRIPLPDQWVMDLHPGPLALGDTRHSSPTRCLCQCGWHPLRPYLPTRSSAFLGPGDPFRARGGFMSRVPSGLYRSCHEGMGPRTPTRALRTSKRERRQSVIFVPGAACAGPCVTGPNASSGRIQVAGNLAAGAK